VTPPLVTVHWSEWLLVPTTVKIGCDESSSSIAMMTADGQSGLDDSSRRFDFDTTRVTCADCKALIAEALQVRP